MQAEKRYDNVLLRKEDVHRKSLKGHVLRARW